MTSYDLMTNFKAPETGTGWTGAFSRQFPDSFENGIRMIGGGNTVLIKIGNPNGQGVIESPDAHILLERGSDKKWQVADFYLKEDYYSERPFGRLLDLREVLAKEKDPRFAIGQLLDRKASGASLHEAVARADNMGHISDFIEHVESGRIKPEIVRVGGITADGQLLNRQIIGPAI